MNLIGRLSISWMPLSKFNKAKEPGQFWLGSFLFNENQKNKIDKQTIST